MSTSSEIGSVVAIYKGVKMALKSSPEFMGVFVQIACVVEIQFEPARALKNITSGTTCYA